MPATLSIVIPSHCRPDLLRRCLQSVQRHAPSGTEVIVVDDGSPLGVVSQTAGEFSAMAVRRLPRRRGFCVAANTGIFAAGGVVVELLNDDTEVSAGWAEAALVHFADPAVAAVAPLVLRWPAAKDAQPVIDSAGDCYYLGGVAGKRGHGQPLNSSFLRATPVFGASASSAFFRREVLVELGSFAEQLGAYFEDVDLAFRLHRAGYRVHYEPASRVYHHGSASHGRPRHVVEQQSRNEELVFWRNLPRSAWREALPAHLAVLLAKTWRRSVEGGLIPFLAGRLRVLAQLGELRRHRRWLESLGPAADWQDWPVEKEFWQT